MGLLQLSAALALVVAAFAAPIQFDCDNTNIFVNDYIQQNFTIGPNAVCLYSFNWRDNAGAFISAHSGFIDNADFHNQVNLYNDFAGGQYISFGNHSGYLFYDMTQYFAPGTVMLSIRTGPNSTISFKMSVTVSTATKGATIQTAQVVTGSQPLVISNDLKLGTTYVYSSTSAIVLAVASAFSGYGNATYFDSVFVYDGQGPNAKLLGSLNQMSSRSQLLTSTSITLFPTSQASQDGIATINNAQNVGGFNVNNMRTYLSSASFSNTSGAMVLTDNGLGSASIVSYGIVGGQADYPIITGIQFYDDNSVVQLYSGLPTNKMAGNYLKQFTNATAANQFPQAFPGTAITFTITRGTAYIYYTSALSPTAKQQRK